MNWRTKKRLKRLASLICLGTSGYLAFEVLAHLTDRTTARLAGIAFILFCLGMWFGEET
jgi:hypothetical protein